MTNPILVIAGSVRARRIALKVADWVAHVGEQATARRFEVVDLAEWPLPMDDEPAIAKTGSYERDHTCAWAAKIAAAPAFVFVTPQYNGGYPAALKNAIDHLYAEWVDKPAAIITYGGHGGGHCGEQLDMVCRFVKLKPIAARPALTLPHEIIAENIGDIDPSKTFAPHLVAVREVLIELDDALGRPKMHAS